MDFIFTSVLKVSFHFYAICFDFLFFIIIKLQPETKGKKKQQLSSRAFLGFFFHLKLPQYLELLKMRKNCPFIFTESLFQGISIFWWKMVCWHFPSRAFTECAEHSPANTSLPRGWCTSPFRPRELRDCGCQLNATRDLELGDQSRQSSWASHITGISADVDLLWHFQLFPLPQILIFNLQVTISSTNEGSPASEIPATMWHCASSNAFCCREMLFSWL